MQEITDIAVRELAKQSSKNRLDATGASIESAVALDATAKSPVNPFDRSEEQDDDAGSSIATPRELVRRSGLWARRKAAAALVAADHVAMTTESTLGLTGGEKYALRPAGTSILMKQSRVRVDHRPHLVPGANIHGALGVSCVGSWQMILHHKLVSRAVHHCVIRVHLCCCARSVFLKCLKRIHRTGC